MRVPFLTPTPVLSGLFDLCYLHWYKMTSHRCFGLHFPDGRCHSICNFPSLAVSPWLSFLVNRPVTSLNPHFTKYGEKISFKTFILLSIIQDKVQASAFVSGTLAFEVELICCYFCQFLVQFWRCFVFAFEH